MIILKSTKRKAITFIEVIIDAALLSILSLVVITSLLDGLQTVKQSGSISAAGQLANEQIEQLRNLSYNSLATAQGAIYPQGTLLDNQTLTHNNISFKVHTDIRYVDDAYDGTAGNVSNNDSNPADYKKITVTIYDSVSDKQLAILSTDISSRAAETSSDTGVLKIFIIDASGAPVSGAWVTITNATINPALIIIATTDSEGIITIPNLPPVNGYHVSATSTGMSTDTTSPLTVTNPNPSNPDAKILLQQVTTLTLNIDQLSTIHLTALGLGASSVNSLLSGQKLIGTNPDISKTNTSITVLPDTIINNVEFDSYNITPSSGWYIRSCSPVRPFKVNPSTTADETCTFSQDATDIQIEKITPSQTGASDGISMSITGANFINASVFIKTVAGSEIQITGLVANDTNTSLEGIVDLSSVPIGTYQVIIRNSNAKETIQENGLIIQ